MKVEPLIEPPIPVASGPDTKQRLLDAAIKIFSEKGFQASSMRAITRAAGTSLSAANYHFGSKEELLRSALRARAEVLNGRRLELLEQARSGGRDSFTVEAILDAFIRPVFERQAAMKAEGSLLPGLAIRLYLDPPEVIAKIRDEAFESTNRDFTQALTQVLPGLSDESAQEVLRFVLGVVVHTVSQRQEPERPGSRDTREEEFSQLERVVCFAAAGARAVALMPRYSPSSEELF